MIEIYADGAYNAGLDQGGWSVVILEDSQKRVFSGMAKKTTNNRMELTAALEGILRTLQHAEVVIYTDSQYLFGSMTKGWQRRVNRDLWERLDEAVGERKVRWELIRGDAKNPFHKEAHNLAISAASRGETVRPLPREDEKRYPKVSMIDIGEKPDTEREAVAKGWVRMQPSTLKLLREGGLAKGDALAAAQVAGVMAAKRTPELIPLCHPLLLTDVKVEFQLDEEHSVVEVRATVKSKGKTGVEMEALTAVAISALTIYDMCKGVDPGMRIEEIRLVRKSGGKSGTVGFE